ncbi:MAG: Cof-type HAD-IIB family hydrolase [Melioribacter sp.]|nr:Cof-type HAD-IIB family hydrolase [Melioribacter sp.]
MKNKTKEIFRKIKLVLFDLDGTLVDDKSNLREDTIFLIKTLKEKGVKFSIASGRIFYSFQNYVYDLEIDVPVIALDGAYIINPVNEELISSSFLNHKHVKRALKLAEKYFLNVALCGKEAIYCTKENETVKYFINKYGADYKLVSSYEPYFFATYEIILSSASGEQLQKALKKMVFPYTFGVYTSFYKSSSSEQNYIAEIRKMGVDKGKAFCKLCKYLGIKVNNTAVVGDWYNDISLFHTNAYKVAMTNAVPEIKALADMITQKDNNEFGINEFLQKLLEAKE